MKRRLFPAMVVFIAVGSVSSNVIESNASYSCCENPTLKFNGSCENTWNTNGKPFAHVRGASKNCKHPCKKIEDGLLQLAACVNVPVNAIMVCARTSRMVEEKHIHYYSQRCSRGVSNRLAPGNQGSVGLALLVVIGGGL